MCPLIFYSGPGKATGLMIWSYIYIYVYTHTHTHSVLVWLCVCVCVCVSLCARTLLPLNISWDFFLRSEKSFCFSINQPPCLLPFFTITVLILPHRRSLSWARYIQSILYNILKINLKNFLPTYTQNFKKFLIFQIRDVMIVRKYVEKLRREESFHTLLLIYENERISYFGILKSKRSWLCKVG